MLSRPRHACAMPIEHRGRDAHGGKRALHIAHAEAVEPAVTAGEST